MANEVRLHLNHPALEGLYKTKEVVEALRDEAEKIRGRVHASAHLTLSTRAGVSGRGAFAQVIMSGPGALTEEFGNRGRAPKAPLRRAMGEAY